MGEPLGRYTLYRRIGVGGMAEVFLAREKVEGGERLCVVKRAHAFLRSDPTALRMFLDEAQLVAQLRHPNIVQIFDLGSINDVFFTAMEYVPGFDLLTVIQEHDRQGEVIAEPIAARIIAQAALALDHAHNAVGQNGQPLEIIHRDVSPQNILLSTRGEVKLIDFGVAKASIAKHSTQTGIVKGKYAYMSPEQIAGKPLDRRTDVFALGLVLYELLTNTRAIAGDDEQQIAENAGRGRIAPVQTLRPNLSEGLLRILARCLDPMREGRYATAAEVAADLERHLAAQRQRVGPEDCARLLKMVGSDPEVSLEELEADEQNASDDEEVTGVEATAIRSSPSHLRPTQPSMPAPIPLVIEAARPGPAPAKTEPALEHVTQQSTPVLRRQVSAGARAPEEPIPPPVAFPRRRGKTWLAATVAGVVALVLAAAAVWHFKGSSGPGTVQSAVAPGEPTTTPIDPSGTAAEPGKVSPPADPSAAAEPAEPSPTTGDPSATAEAEPAEPSPTPGDPSPVAAAKPTELPAGTADPEHPRAPAAPARLTIEATPQMDVLVDGRKRGRTPLELTLAAGAHRVEWKDAPNGLTRALKLKLAPAQQRTESWSPKKGTLTIEVVPFGEISVDGKSLGVTSWKSLELWEGHHTVRVVNDELKRTEDRGVDVAPGAESKTVFKLL